MATAAETTAVGHSNSSLTCYQCQLEEANAASAAAANAHTHPPSSVGSDHIGSSHTTPDSASVDLFPNPTPSIPTVTTSEMIDASRLPITPYRKMATRKRTYSYGTHSPRMNTNILPPPDLFNSTTTSPASPINKQTNLRLRKPLEPRQLFSTDDPTVTSNSLGLPPFPVNVSASTDPNSPSYRRPQPSPPPQLGLLKLTDPSGVSHRNDPLPLAEEEVFIDFDPDDVEESLEEDSEAELEGEVQKDVYRWWTPAGIWAQIVLLLGLAVKFARILGMSFQWMKMTWRLILFSIALAPAWFLIGRTYFTAKYIKRSIRYGVNARNYVDLYFPHRIINTDSAAANGHLCAHHRAAQESKAELIRKRSVDSLSLVERLHLDSLIQAVAGVAPAGAGPSVDANALLELNDALKQQAVDRIPPSKSDATDSNASSASGGPIVEGDRAGKFAAQLISNDAQPAPRPPTTPSSAARISSAARCDSAENQPLASFNLASTASSSLTPAQLAPVVIYLTGGAWSIGNKAWGGLLGLGLSAHGILVASVDYRNFPQGDVNDMCRDVHTAIAWVFRHAEEYGGDPKRIFLVGQSAGAHLGSLCILQNVESLLRGQKTSWTSKHLAGFVGISGCYDLPSVKQHFHERGLPLWVFQRMMRSTTDEELSKYSPVQLLQNELFREHSRAFQKLMPAFLLIHGKGDKTVHWQASHEFARALHAVKVKVKARYYKNYSHTDPIIEGPLTGHDHLCHDLLYFIHDQTAASAVPQPTSGGSRSVSSTVSPPMQRGTSESSSNPSASNQPGFISPLNLNTTTSPPTIRTLTNRDHQSDDCIAENGDNGNGHRVGNGTYPPPRPSSPLTLSSLFSTLCAPFSYLYLPAFLLPSRARRPSHLPHPFQAVDDVEEDADSDVNEDLQQEIDFNAGLSPNNENTKFEVDMRPWTLRVWSALADQFGWLVPSIIQRQSVKLMQPIVRFLSDSPPPMDASPTIAPGGEKTTNWPNSDEFTKAATTRHSSNNSSTNSLESSKDSLEPKSVSTSSGRYDYPLQPGADLPRTPPQPLISRYFIRVARWINPF